MTYRLGILVSHPIQYYAPWFRYLAERMQIEVFYAHRQDGQGQAEAGFGVEFEWDTPLLDGYEYHWLKNVSAEPSIRTFRGLDTPELIDIIKPGRFDAFLLFSWNRKCSWQAIRACRKAKVPVLMRGDSHLANTRSRVTSLTKYLPYRAFLPRIDAHLYVGQRNKAYLTHYGVPEKKLFFSPHFVDSDFFRQRARDAKTSGTDERIRGELGVSQNAFVFLFVGKLIPKKRSEDIVKAFERITSANSEANIHLVFVGDGPLLQSLTAAARGMTDRIHFTGFRNQTELPAYYQASNALILPSDGDETWGLVVNEAFSCGLPAIVSDAVGCAPDLIEEERTGLTFSCGSIDQLSTQMVKLMRLCDSHASSISNAVHEKVTEYSMTTATNGLYVAMDALSVSHPLEFESNEIEQELRGPG